MSPIPPGILEAAPFGFSLFLNVTSFLQDRLVETWMENAIKDYYPTIEHDAVQTIARFAVDVGQRINFIVALLISILSSVAFALEHDYPWLLLCVVFSLAAALAIGFFVLMRLQPGQFIYGRSFITTPSNWCNLVLMIVNFVFIVAASKA